MARIIPSFGHGFDSHRPLQSSRNVIFFNLNIVGLFSIVIEPIVCHIGASPSADYNEFGTRMLVYARKNKKGQPRVTG